MIPHISLEQWATLQAVVEEGSFAKAAERLNKSKSSVGYIINRLQAQLPSKALQLDGRKAVLTEAGKLLYRHACSLLEQATAIERIADYLASGWETEISLAIDAIIPRAEVFSALQLFSVQYPQPRINIFETTLSGTDEAILFRKVDIALTPVVVTGFMGVPLAHIVMRYVVSPAHPLAQLQRPIDLDDLKQYRQIVIKDSGTKRQQNAGWLGAEQRWSVSHISSSIEATCAGLGFANLPLTSVRSELSSGKLVQLNMAFNTHTNLPLYLIKTAQNSAGPAVETLSQVLVEQFHKMLAGR